MVFGRKYQAEESLFWAIVVFFHQGFYCWGNLVCLKKEGKKKEYPSCWNSGFLEGILSGNGIVLVCFAFGLNVLTVWREWEGFGLKQRMGRVSFLFWEVGLLVLAWLESSIATLSPAGINYEGLLDSPDFTQVKFLCLLIIEYAVIRKTVGFC